MKKIYYEIEYEYEDDGECMEVGVTSCPYGMKNFFQNIVKVGSYLCIIKCIHKTESYNDNLHYVYCNHPETYNRNKANKK